SRPDEIMRAVNEARQRIVLRWETMKHDQLRDRLLEQLVSEDTQWDARTTAQATKLLPRLRLQESAVYQAVIIGASGWGNEQGYNKLLLFAVHNMISELVQGEALLREDSVLLLYSNDYLDH